MKERQGRCVSGCASAVGTVQLSRQTGIDPGTIRRILSGQQSAISTRNMVALAKFFGVSLRELMDKLT